MIPMIRVKIKKSSDWKYSDFKEFANLEQAVDYAISLHGGYSPEIIVTKGDYEIGQWNPETKQWDGKLKPHEDCDYELELYDDYRE
jgi:hypothetical protein